MAKEINPQPLVDDPYTIMPDGYARGFPGDSQYMRANYRTPNAIMRQADDAGQDVKEAIQQYLNREAALRRTRIKKLANG